MIHPVGGKMMSGGQCSPMGGCGSNMGMAGGQLFPTGGSGSVPMGMVGGQVSVVIGGKGKRRRTRRMRGGQSALSPLSLEPDTNNVFNVGNYASTAIPGNKLMMGGDGYAYGGENIGGLGSPVRYTAAEQFANRGGNNILSGGKKSKKWLNMKGCSGGRKKRRSTKRGGRKTTKRSGKKNKSRRRRMRGGCGLKPLGYAPVE